MQGIGAWMQAAWPASSWDTSRPPYVSQRRPVGAPKGFDGSASCGPACMTMVARMIGYRRDLSDYQLIIRFSGIGETTMEDGTEPEGILAIAKELGRKATLRHGHDVEPMRRAILRGSVVIVNGEYYAMPPHEDPDQREGHWVLAYGLAKNGDFLVHDTEDPSVRTVTPEVMQRFLAEHSKGGRTVELELAPPSSLAHQRIRTPTKKGDAPISWVRTY